MFCSPRNTGGCRRTIWTAAWRRRIRLGLVWGTYSEVDGANAAVRRSAGLAGGFGRVCVRRCASGGGGGAIVRRYRGGVGVKARAGGTSARNHRQPRG